MFVNKGSDKISKSLLVALQSRINKMKPGDARLVQPSVPPFDRI